MATYTNAVSGEEDKCYDVLDPEVFENNGGSSNRDKVMCLTHFWKKANCEQDVLTLVIINCYFALTTLSTVGYGDLYPKSTNEMYLGILLMLTGIVFFSQIMNSFIAIVQNYDHRMGSEEHSSDLQNWMAQLVRFADKS